MGYSEVVCNICNVSFNVGRTRCADEPRSAGWSGSGREFYVDGHHGEQCGRNSGCKFVVRNAIEQDAKSVWRVNEGGRLSQGDRTVEDHWHDDSDDEQDGDYVHQSGGEDEPLEYSSGDDDRDRIDLEYDFASARDTDHEAIDRKDDRNSVEVDDEETWLRDFWHRTYDRSSETKNFLRNADALTQSTFSKYCKLRENEGIQDDMLPVYLPIGDVDSQDERSEPVDDMDVEHIAGPGCQIDHGYNGSGISAEEARFALTLQCLVRKPPAVCATWKAFEPDDEDWERDGKYFLSGLSDHMPSRDMEVPRVYPPRHECTDPHAENHLVFADHDDEEYAMPFHPYCLEVFKRASGMLVGKVADIEGLVEWWRFRSASSYDDHMVDRESESCQGQWWNHARGTEYLVANPLSAENLSEILLSAVIADEEVNFHHNGGAFQLSTHQYNENQDDPFTVLPHELRMQVLLHLRSKDIANLRLSSRSFRQLPISCFHELIMREMPFLWEAWSLPEHQYLQTRPYAVWALSTETELKAREYEVLRKRQAVNHFMTIVGEEMPEVKEQLVDLRSAYEIQFAEEEAHAGKTVKPIALPYFRTNWYQLYTLITRHWGSLRSLQNRRRIWTDCEIIIDDMQILRESGRIPVEDPSSLTREYWARTIAERGRREAEQQAEREVARTAAHETS